MAVFNILDQRRQNEYDPREVDVVFEVFEVFVRDKTDFTEWMPRISIHDATMLATQFNGKVTMYLYDGGWVGTNFGFIVTIHPKLKRDPMIPHQYDPDLLRWPSV